MREYKCDRCNAITPLDQDTIKEQMYYVSPHGCSGGDYYVHDHFFTHCECGRRLEVNKEDIEKCIEISKIHEEFNGGRCISRSLEKENGLIIYAVIKEAFEEEGLENSWFYKDHFKDANPGDFIEELRKNESWLDLSKKPTKEDIETIIQDISDEMAASALITRQIDNITDKYIGDGIINY